MSPKDLLTRVRGLFKDNDELPIPFHKAFIGGEGAQPLGFPWLGRAVLGGVDLLNKILSSKTSSRLWSLKHGVFCCDQTYFWSAWGRSPPPKLTQQNLISRFLRSFLFGLLDFIRDQQFRGCRSSVQWPRFGFIFWAESWGFLDYKMVGAKDRNKVKMPKNTPSRFFLFLTEFFVIDVN